MTERAYILIHVDQQRGEQRIGRLNCFWCGAQGIPFHFYVGESSPLLGISMQALHIARCKTIPQSGGTEVRVTWPAPRETDTFVYDLAGKRFDPPIPPWWE
jgi:hypothetical protein